MRNATERKATMAQARPRSIGSDSTMSYQDLSFRRRAGTIERTNHENRTYRNYTRARADPGASRHHQQSGIARRFSLSHAESPYGRRAGRTGRSLLYAAVERGGQPHGAAADSAVSGAGPDRERSARHRSGREDDGPGPGK